LMNERRLDQKENQSNKEQNNTNEPQKYFTKFSYIVVQGNSHKSPDTIVNALKRELLWKFTRFV